MLFRHGTGVLKAVVGEDGFSASAPPQLQGGDSSMLGRSINNKVILEPIPARPATSSLESVRRVLLPISRDECTPGGAATKVHRRPVTTTWLLD